MAVSFIVLFSFIIFSTVAMFYLAYKNSSAKKFFLSTSCSTLKGWAQVFQPKSAFIGLHTKRIKLNSVVVCSLTPTSGF